MFQMRPALVSIFLALVVTTSVHAAPMEFVIFRTSDPTDELGVFTVDPDLAAPAGVSSVAMSSLTFTEEVSPFGELTITLGDIGNPATFQAIFSDGEISEITGLGSGMLPGGISFFLDFTPKGDPTNIDLDAVGTFALDAGDGMVIGDSATGSIGIRLSTTPIPEPGTFALLTAGLSLIGARRLRRHPRD